MPGRQGRGSSAEAVWLPNGERASDCFEGGHAHVPVRSCPDRPRSASLPPQPFSRDAIVILGPGGPGINEAHVDISRPVRVRCPPAMEPRSTLPVTEQATTGSSGEKEAPTCMDKPSGHDAERKEPAGRGHAAWESPHRKCPNRQIV